MISCALHACHGTVIFPQNRALSLLWHHHPSDAFAHLCRQFFRHNAMPLHCLHSQMDLILSLRCKVKYGRHHFNAVLFQMIFQLLFQMTVLKNTRIQFSCCILDHFCKAFHLTGIAFPVLHYFVIPEHHLLSAFIALQSLPQEPRRSQTLLLHFPF